MTIDVVFAIPQSSLDEFLADVARHPELEPEVHRTAAASGGGDTVTVLFSLASATLGALTTLTTVWLKRGASVELGGKKVNGISRAVADQLAIRLVESHIRDSTHEQKQTGGSDSREPLRKIDKSST